MEEEKNSRRSDFTLNEIEALVDQNIIRIQSTVESLIEQKLKDSIKEFDDKKSVEDQKKGIPLSGFLDFARFFSIQASAANRSLALGGIAVIWVFKKPEKQEIVHGLLNLPLIHIMRLAILWNIICFLSLVPHHTFAAVLAIDYGTEWIKASLLKPGIPFDVMLNKDSKRKMQSAVAWKRTERLFGSDAANLVRE